jgi:AcrR family transcriptional regulator
VSGDPLFGKLKPGPGRSQEEVRASQRARLEAALVELVAKRGRAGLTVRGLTRTSGVSTRTLYAHFTNLDECFVSAYRSLRRAAAVQLAEASAGEPSPASVVHAWVHAALDAAAAKPEATRFALLDAYDGGPAMLRVIEDATAALERQLALALSDLPLPLARAIVAGIERVVRVRLLQGREAELPGRADELMDWVRRVGESAAAFPPEPAPRAHSIRAGSNGAGASFRADPGFAAFAAIGGERGRILAASARLALANGYWGLTPSRIRREAGVSRRTFDALYDGVESCYLEATEALVVAAARRAAGSLGTELGRRPWLEGLAANLCAELARSPLLARLALSDAFVPGSAGLRLRERILTRATAWLCASAPTLSRPGELAAEASLAGAWRSAEGEFDVAAPMPRSQTPHLVSSLVLAFQPPAAPQLPDRVHVSLDTGTAVVPSDRGGRS